MNSRIRFGLFVISSIILLLSLPKSIICKDKKFKNPKTNKFLFRNTDVNRINIGRCRTHCLNQFYPSIGNDTYQNNMMMCWDLCEMLYIQPIWENVCIESSICFSGCQTSCNFVSRNPKLNPLRFVDGRAYKNDILKIEFEIKKYSHHNSLCFHWNLIEESAGSIVYVVFRRSFKKWEELVQTTLNEYCEKGKVKRRNPKYLIVAVTETGLLALDINRYKLIEKSLSNVIENGNHHSSKLMDDILKIETSTNRKRSLYSNTLSPNTSFKKLKRDIIMEACVIVFLTISLIIITFYLWILVRYKEPNVQIAFQPADVENGKKNNQPTGHKSNIRKFVNQTYILSLIFVNKIPHKFVTKFLTPKLTKPFYV
ncbi:unnamed protein product [Gordionus sp. m RMFG-2023]|uniref:uncharacterized protein LOC135929893 n=1 Tax=Gordionus sp. m RMFG-2023 TaxID=3053472 RepID=UPI0030E5E1C7